MKGVMSATEYLEDFLPPVLVGEDMKTLLRPAKRRGGVQQNSVFWCVGSNGVT